MATWTDFFIAAAGASAALAGLVFVSLSVNIGSILQMPHLPSRAAATIAMLMLILVCSMVVLIPQPLGTLGAEIIVFALYGLWRQLVSARRGFLAARQLHRPRWESVFNAVLGQVQVWPFIAGGVLFLRGWGAGFYWIAVGCMAIFIFAVLNAWVLLVEILR
jgi:hypothetical protein